MNRPSSRYFEFYWKYRAEGSSMDEAKRKAVEAVNAIERRYGRKELTILEIEHPGWRG